MVAIKYHYCNALNRREEEGDRETALRLMLKDVVSGDKAVPDHVGLVGRIYKDKYIRSSFAVGHLHFDVIDKHLRSSLWCISSPLIELVLSPQYLHGKGRKIAARCHQVVPAGETVNP